MGIPYLFAVCFFLLTPHSFHYPLASSILFSTCYLVLEYQSLGTGVFNGFYCL